MIKIEKVDVWGFEHAIRGMRNPLNSWERSDSALCKGAEGFEDCTVNVHGVCPRRDDFREDVFCIGQSDHELMTKLSKGGSPHRKFFRQIMVSLDITAPLYWWKEFDTYKIGTTANSCSTMHKIHSKPFTLDDFSCEQLDAVSIKILKMVIEELNFNIDCFANYENIKDELPNTERKQFWWNIIQLLPTSYNQKRTVTLNYENLLNILEYRRGHKLDEWNIFCDWIMSLPYAELLEAGVKK